MEIKRIKEESYESVVAYLNEMMSFVSRYDDLCFVDHNGKRYMAGVGDEKIVIIENNNGELNPYYLAFPDPMVEKFGMEEYTYDIVTQPDLKEVIRKSTISDDCERLSYLPRVEDFPRDTVEYAQFIDELFVSMLQKYDVTQRSDVNSSLVYCQYHEPDIIRIEALKKRLFWEHRVTYDYCLGLRDNFYYQPLIRIGDILMGTKRVKYPSKEFVEELGKKGFNTIIPDDLISLLTGEHETHKTLKLITDNYQSYIKEQ